MSTTRIYIATDLKTKEQHLIEARTPHQARSFLAKSMIGVRVATTKDVVDIMSGGGPVQDATTEKETDDRPLEVGDGDAV